MEDDSIYDGLRDKLSETEWPSVYMFKFIAPSEKVEALTEILYDLEYTAKPSRTGKYISITSTVVMDSPDSIIDIYMKASLIEGVIAL